MFVIRQILARRHVATLILACVLAVRVLIPAGFMIGETASGTPALILCPGQDARYAPQVTMRGMHHDMPHMMPDGSLMSRDHDPGKHPDPGTDRPCAFAAVGLAVDMPVPAPLLAPPPPTFVGLLHRVPSDPGHGLAAPPPPSTGPPTIA